MGVECICRCIYSEDYPTELALRTRIMDNDFKCGQCQMRYMLESSTTVNSSQIPFIVQHSANSV